MPYVGNKPEVGNFRKCDAITTSATATYNLLVGGVAVNPNQNQCIVSLNGVIQAPGTSYTIASSQITFASALTSSDVIDFILILGDTLDVGVPSDDTVDASKITANVITGQSALGATPADTDELLISDAGTLKRVDYSHIKGGENTPAFQAYLSGTQSISTNTMTKVEFNTEVFDTAGAYDNSTNYRFTPLTAGKYVVYATVFTGGASSGSSSHGGFITNIKKNGADSSYNAFYLYNNTTGVDGTMNAISVFDMNGSSDYVECFAYSRQNTATVQLGASQTYFGAYKLIGV